MTSLIVAFLLAAPALSSRGYGLGPSYSRAIPYGEGTEPEFTSVMDNMTVPAGRSVRLSCSVKNLGNYRVAWMHYEQSAILAVHSQVITRNPRITVSHENHRTWNLHIADVRQEDAGRYMCQINTPAAKTQFAYLNVVVPPDIDDSLSSSDVITREGSNVSLACTAYGSPEPIIKWKRDDGQKININKTLTVSEFEGSSLEMTRISRLDMGAYLCIASNGVPPTVSKRIRLSVDFPPMLWIPHQLVGAPVGSNVSLECYTEAHPNALNYWTRDDGHMIHDSSKYSVSSRMLDLPYKAQMRLTIYNLRTTDFGTYKCVAKNPRGETDGTIRLYDSQIDLSNEVHHVSNTELEKGHKENGIDDVLGTDEGPPRRHDYKNSRAVVASFPEPINGVGRIEPLVGLLLITLLLSF